MWALWSYVSPSRPQQLVVIPNPTRAPPPVLSHVVVCAATKNDNDNLKPTELKLQSKSKPNQDDHISGSDVLWAMRKAANKKTKHKKNKNKNGTLSGREEPIVGVGGAFQNDDYYHDNVIIRPLVVKRDWATQLAHLEMRLNELSDTK